MGCQKEIAKKIVAGGGDYLLTVKGNQEHLLKDVQATLGGRDGEPSRGRPVFGSIVRRSRITAATRNVPMSWSRM